MAQDNVITAPLAIVKVGTEIIGKMRGIRVTENIQRGKVMGLGSLVPKEIPALSWAGTLQCDFYNITLTKSQIPGAIFRNGNVATFEDCLLLQQDGVTVDIYKKIISASSPNPGNASFSTNNPIWGGSMQAAGDPNITDALELFAQVRGLFLDSEGFDINEGSISGRNQSFQYLNPIVFV